MLLAALATLVLMTLLGNADAQTITLVSAGEVITKMPGSPTDFDLFSQVANPLSSDLTNFSVGTGVNPHGGPLDSGSNTILTPAGNSVATGVDYQGPGGDLNLIQFELNSTPVNFNFADFNVYVLISSFSPGWTINDIALASGTDATSATLIPVNDTYLATGGRVVEFNISGASGGDVFTLATTSSASTHYIEGVSFESVPEPSTYAMIFSGLAFLGFVIRRKAALLG